MYSLRRRNYFIHQGWIPAGYAYNNSGYRTSRVRIHKMNSMQMRMLIVLIILSSSGVCSQTFQLNDLAQIKYRFSHLSVSDGLSSGPVNCFYKDRKGFIWIRTSTGLNRYDGYRMPTYNPDPADSLAVRGNTRRF